MKKTLLLLFASAALSVQATVFYVNPKHPSASDSNWGDTPDSPWATLNIKNWNENDTIMVANSTYTLTEKGYVNKEVTVIGESKDGVVIQGEDDMSFNFNMTTCRFFSIETGVEATFRNLTIKNLLYDWHNGEADASSAYGGAFEMTPTSVLNLTNVDIRKIKIYGNGGNAWGAAIMLRGVMNADSCLFESCYATQGGAVYAADGSTGNFSNCRFIGNGNPESSDYDTYRFGGAVCMTGASTLNVDKCYFEDNFTEKNGNGGAIMIRYDSDKVTTLDVSNSTFAGNTSAYGGSVLYCGTNTTATSATALDIAFKNCVFYENVGNVGYMQYNNTISLPANANYTSGKGRFVFVNNSLFGNFNPARTNTRSISLGDVAMEYYFINNMMNDNENEDGTAQSGTYGLVLEGSYDVAPVNVSRMVVLGNVFNATGGAFSSPNYPDLDVTMYPEKKNYLGQRLMRTRQQTALTASDAGVAPYLDFTTSADSVSVALNNGVNEYLLDDVNIVPQTDILGNPLSGVARDAGAWEMQAAGSGIGRQDADGARFVFPSPFSNSLNVQGQVDRIEFYNVEGQCVAKFRRPGNAVDVSALSPGLYIIRTVAGNVLQVQKAVKR